MTRSGRSGTPRHRIEAVTQPRYDGGHVPARRPHRTRARPDAQARMKRVAGAHAHAGTKTSFRYDATWHVEGRLLTWKAAVSLPGRRWSLAGGTPDWTGGGEAKAVRDDIARSIDGLEL
jgi:hypothetical protein